MSLYRLTNMGQSPEDYGNPQTSELPPDADPCDPNNDYYDEALCEELKASGEYQAPEEVAPPPGDQGQGYPQAPQAPSPPSGSPGGGQGSQSSDSAGPTVQPGGTAPQSGGTAPDGSPLAPGQGVNPDGTPSTDQAGNPTDANGNPVDENGNPLDQPADAAPQDAAPITFCDNLISMMMGTSPVKWITHPQLGEVGVGKVIGPPGQPKLPTYTIVSKNIFLQDPSSGKLNYVAFADLSNAASQALGQAGYKEDYNQSFRAQCPQYMDLMDLLNAGYQVNQPGFDASTLPIPGWQYQATDDPALSDAMMGASIPSRDSSGRPRVMPTKGRTPITKSSQGKRRIPLGAPGVKVPANLKGYFVRSKKARNAARNKAQTSAANSVMPNVSRPGYQPTVQNQPRMSRAANVPGGSFSKPVRQATSLRAGTQSVVSRGRR
jgi:hypothetical protein